MYKAHSPRIQQANTALKVAHRKVDMQMLYRYACGMFAGTVSGLLAYAISFLNGVGGHAGRRWAGVAELFLGISAYKYQLFIFEATLPMICSIYTYFCLPDSPLTVKFLREDEYAAILSDLPQ